MNKATAVLLIHKKLASELACGTDIFGEAGVKYVINEEEQKSPSFQVVAVGDSVIVSVAKRWKNRVMPFLKDRTREELFECPFLYGESIYYIPDFKTITRPKLTGGLTYRQLEGEELSVLDGVTGFSNALDYDSKGKLISKIAFAAMDHGKIIGIAGANEVFEGMWEIGVDVAEGYRGQGLASILVGNLTMEIIDHGIVPIYCAASTNITSQAVAYRSGLIPAWVSSYRTYLDESRCFDPLEDEGK